MSFPRTNCQVYWDFQDSLTSSGPASLVADTCVWKPTLQNDILGVPIGNMGGGLTPNCNTVFSCKSLHVNPPIRSDKILVNIVCSYLFDALKYTLPYSLWIPMGVLVVRCYGNNSVYTNEVVIPLNVENSVLPSVESTGTWSGVLEWSDSQYHEFYGVELYYAPDPGWALVKNPPRLNLVSMSAVYNIPRGNPNDVNIPNIARDLPSTPVAVCSKPLCLTLGCVNCPYGCDCA